MLDIVLSSIAIILVGWIIAFAVIIATIDTKRFGLFRQKRIGRQGVVFLVYKVRTMKDRGDENHITVSSDDRITQIGRLFRATKIDELPQLLNVLMGDMSLVGPRPDVEGYWDKLEGDARRVLELRPGLTGPATILFMDEEELLERQDDPKHYNDNILFPKKVSLNLEYYDNYTFLKDLKCIYITFKSVVRRWKKLILSMYYRGSLLLGKKL